MKNKPFMLAIRKKPSHSLFSSSIHLSVSIFWVYKNFEKTYKSNQFKIWNRCAEEHTKVMEKIIYDWYTVKSKKKRPKNMHNWDVSRFIPQNVQTAIHFIKQARLKEIHALDESINIETEWKKKRERERENREKKREEAGCRGREGKNRIPREYTKAPQARFLIPRASLFGPIKIPSPSDRVKRKKKYTK